jgi:hypothetical protein
MRLEFGGQPFAVSLLKCRVMGRGGPIGRLLMRRLRP